VIHHGPLTDAKVTHPIAMVETTQLAALMARSSPRLSGPPCLKLTRLGAVDLAAKAVITNAEKHLAARAPALDKNALFFRPHDSRGRDKKLPNESCLTESLPVFVRKR
jgi:hypothetical protein